MADYKARSPREAESTQKRSRQASARHFLQWFAVLCVYAALLGGIGYIAFWNQDFNDAKSTIGPYVNVLEEARARNYESPEFEQLVQESMKVSADGAGDLQELASQSFNIVLGAILAFLSATTTTVFQQINTGREEGPKDDKEEVA